MSPISLWPYITLLLSRSAHVQEPAKTAHFCSMCGPKFCSMNITQVCVGGGESAEGGDPGAGAVGV